MKVLMAASESTPYAKTGGLADVMGSLSEALSSKGVDVRVVLPLYRAIKKQFNPKATGLEVTVPLGRKSARARLYSSDERAWFIDCPEYFDRKELYGTPQGDYDDNAFRFVLFSRAVLEFSELSGFIPDVVHAHDWQAALVPLYMKTLYADRFEDIPSLFTIHNLGYQGLFPGPAMTITGLPEGFFTSKLLEFYGQVNFLKAGLISADAINTVSPRYAKETLSEEYGFGLNGVLTERARDYVGILNGLDYKLWNPSTDELLPATYNAKTPAGKIECRQTLVKMCSFSNPDAPVIGMVGRLARQKGLDLFLKGANELFPLGINFVVLGRGEDDIQDGLKKALRTYPGQMHLSLDFDETFAHLIYAGSDMFLMPSRYEPCGLSQLIAMRYGTVPVVRGTGGLKDTVKDYDHLKKQGNGFVFTGYHESALAECLKRAISVFTSPTQWKKLVRACMAADFSWEKSAAEYLELYRKLIERSVR